MTNLQRFQRFTETLDSPDIYIQWSFYSMISIALGRRVWIQDYANAIFPNLYLMIIGPAAVGKSESAKRAKILLESVKCGKSVKEGKAELVSVTNWAPTNVTVEHLITIMAQKTRVEELPIDGALSKKAFTEWTIFVDGEMGSFFRKNTEDLQRFLTHMYSEGHYERGTQLHQKQEIRNLCLNFIGCATPEWMRSNFSESMLNDGFASRVIMIYAEKPRSYTGYREASNIDLSLELVNWLEKIAQLRGQVQVGQECKNYINEWAEKVWPEVSKRVNQNPILNAYYARKKLHLLKLAMAMHFAESLTMELTVADIQNAEALLELTETSMHMALNNAGKHGFNVLMENAERLLAEAGGELPKKRLEALLITSANKEELGTYTDPPKLVKSCIDFMKRIDKIGESIRDGGKSFVKLKGADSGEV